MLDKNVILTRLEKIDKHLERILSYIELSYEEFLDDENAQDIVEYNLFQTVNHLINITQHIVVDEEYGLPQTAYEASQILCHKGIIENDDLELLKKMIGFRNTVGHDYMNLNKKIVYSILTKETEDIRKLLSKITKEFL